MRCVTVGESCVSVDILACPGGRGAQGAWWGTEMDSQPPSPPNRMPMAIWFPWGRKRWVPPILSSVSLSHCDGSLFPKPRTRGNGAEEDLSTEHELSLSLC